jgi:hypothetical protein
MIWGRAGIEGGFQRFLLDVRRLLREYQIEGSNFGKTL